MSRNILFITETLFKERTGASKAIDGKQIFPMIKVAQDIYIQPILGSTLYKRLQDGIDDDLLTQDEKDLLDLYITDSLVWYTMSLLPMTMGYQLFSKGFLIKTAEEGAAPSQKDLELIEQKYKAMAEFYGARMIAYLQQNWQKYYEYLNPDLGVDVIFPKVDAYSCPIYIGDTRQKTLYLNNSANYIAPTTVYYTASGTISTFNVPELVGRTILAAFRSGLNKIITQDTTTDTGKIQIYGGQVTLPTGDLTMDGELFTFLIR
jgi:hypothetical protein